MIIGKVMHAMLLQLTLSFLLMSTFQIVENRLTRSPTLDKKVKKTEAVRNKSDSEVDSNINSQDKPYQQTPKATEDEEENAIDDLDSYDEKFEIGQGTNFARTFNLKNACLGARDYANAMANVFADASGEVCFSILGHWGRGKTYLMRLTEEQLPENYETVWFSAWKYRTKPELWAYLYESFKGQIKSGPTISSNSENIQRKPEPLRHMAYNPNHLEPINCHNTIWVYFTNSTW